MLSIRQLHLQLPFDDCPTVAAADVDSVSHRGCSDSGTVVVCVRVCVCAITVSLLTSDDYDYDYDYVKRLDDINVQACACDSLYRTITKFSFLLF